MVRFALYFAFSLWVYVGPAQAAQIPEQFHGKWCPVAEKRPLLGGDLFVLCDTGREPPSNEPRPPIYITPDGVETTNTRCTVTRVTEHNACPYGRLSKRPSQFNPSGPIYNVKLQCKEKNGKAFSFVRDWFERKGYLEIVPAPSQRCIYPHPTKPDLR
jgi:hypothetical protein